MAETMMKYSIFISGPSDALPEMELIERVISSLSKVFCPRLGIVLESKMADETVLAGMGRSQDRINPDVKRCDLFIGVYKQRIGTPTGKYISGSVEEYHIAKGRWKEEQTPEIILFFSSSNNIDLENDDIKVIDQNNKLHTFRKQVKDELLFKRFSCSEDLIIKVTEQIIQWVYLVLTPKNEEGDIDG